VRGPGVSHQLPREHRGLREKHGITDLTIGPELVIRTKEHSVGGKQARQVERYLVTVVAPDTVDPALATQPDAIRARH
jgi:hypothetical protein